MADKRPDTYLEDGVRYWRASSLGACDRSLVLGALGHDKAPAPEWLQKAWAEGTGAEEEVLGAARTAGNWKSLVPHEVKTNWGAVDDTGQVLCELDVGTYKGERQVIRCHPDDLVVKHTSWVEDHDDVGVERVVEAKFLRHGSHRDARSAMDVPFYAWQTSVEMAATGMGLLWVVGWKGDDGELVRVDHVEVDEPVYGMREIRRRVFKLARLVHVAEGDGPGDVACSYNMFPCGYWGGGCGQEQLKAEREAEKGRDADDLGLVERGRLTAYAADIHRARVKRDEWEEKRKRWTDEMLEYMRDELGWGAENRVVGNWDVQWTRIEARDAYEEEKVVKHKAREAGDRLVVRIKRADGDGGEG